MDMRGTAGIGHRANGAKTVAPIGRRGETAIPLEPGVEPLAVTAATVQIDTVGIHLPDFHQRPSQWPAARIEDRTVQLHANPARLCGLTVDPHQVVVTVQQQLVGVEGAQRLARRQQPLGQRQCRADQQRAASGEEEMTTAGHGLFPP